MSPPNIVWLTLDSVRADYTSVGDSNRKTTPNIKSIANDDKSIIFSNCYSHAPTTRPSTASILTGVHPSRHQTWGHTECTEVYALPDELITVPQLLGEHGYRTVGISRNSHFSSGTELDRGFDDFSLITPSNLREVIGLKGLCQYALNIRSHSAGLTTELDRHGTAFFVNNLIKRKLRTAAESKKPLFLYAHYNEPHTPYHPPLPYLDQFTDQTSLSPKEAADLSMKMHREVIPKAEPVDYSSDELSAIKAMYKGELVYTDDMVAEIFNYVQSLNLGETIFVITGDHGDLFGERNLVGHMHCLHDGLTNVPLIVYGFDKIAVASDSIVQHADLMQTLLEDIGISSEQFQGIDLRSQKREYAVSQHPPQQDSPPGFHESGFTALRTKKYKYQRGDDGSELLAPPDEMTDVSDVHPDIVDWLDTELDDLMEAEGRPIIEAKEGNMSSSMKQHLQDMGYVQ